MVKVSVQTVDHPINRRLVKVGKNHVEDCKQLLGLMGIPYVEAPCEVSEGYFAFTLSLYSHCFYKLKILKLETHT